MGLVDKIKNMFTEEVEEEPIKKEMIQVSIPSPVESKEEEKEVLVDTKPVLEKPSKTDEKFVFPVYFDDDDFTSLEKSKPKEEKKPLIDSYKGKNTTVVEKKIFKPTPIISPVYGILNKNYSKEDITTKKENKETINRVIDSLDVDLVRNKAYGTLEDEIDTNLYVDIKLTKPEDIEPVKMNHDDMNEYRKRMEEVDSIEKDELDVLEESLDVVIENKRASKKRTAKEETIKELDELKEEINEPITENDLFDMIDTMYEGGE